MAMCAGLLGDRRDGCRLLDDDALSAICRERTSPQHLDGADGPCSRDDGTAASDHNRRMSRQCRLARASHEDRRRVHRGIYSVSDIEWSEWGSQSASGTGTVSQNTCQPNGDHSHAISTGHSSSSPTAGTSHIGGLDPTYRVLVRDCISETCRSRCPNRQDRSV